jgi:hypothetical protein
MQWIVPQLSEQEFEIEAEIVIINVQSYPVVGGEWKVRFTTNGTSDLIITAVNGTTFGESLPDDLKFLELNNGTHTLTPIIQGNSVIYHNYTSTENGFETSQVMTSGKHHLMFQFGNDVQFAHNAAGVPDFKIQSGVLTMTGTTASLNEGTDYDACSSTTSCFIMVSSSINGRNGGTISPDADIDYQAHILDDSGIATALGTIDFVRDSTSADAVIYWQIIEYIGSSGGDNEMIVRDTGLLGFTTQTSLTGSTISPTTAGDVAVLITSNHNSDAGRNEWDATSFTTELVSGTTPTVTRIDVGANDVHVSYVAVEFTGSNWSVERVSNISDTSASETVTISDIGATSRGFVLQGQVRTPTGQSAI